MSSTVSNVIKQFGGITKMSKAISVPVPTINNWNRSFIIPAKYLKLILDTAKELGINIIADDLIIDPNQTEPTQHKDNEND